MQPWGLLLLALFLGFFSVALVIVMSDLALLPALLLLGIVGAVIIIFAVAVS